VNTIGRLKPAGGMQASLCAASVFDPAGAVRGRTTWKAWRPLAEDPSSEVAVAVIAGERPGPTLWLEGAIHGNEIDSAIFVQKLVEAVNPSDLRGTLIAVPVVNTAAFVACQRDGPADGKDANRQFPGRADGSYSEQLADAIRASVEAHADYVIDVHSSTETFLALSHALYFAADTDVSRRSQALARRSCVDVIWESSGDYMASALYCWTVQHNIPTALLDVGDLDVPPGLKASVAGGLNMLAFAEMLPAPAFEAREPYTVRDPRWVVAERAGIVVQYVTPGSWVDRGAKLFDVLDVRGDVLHTGVSPVDNALVLTTRRLKRVGQGDWVISLGAITHDPARRS
jgi:predicted deacylase